MLMQLMASQFICLLSNGCSAAACMFSHAWGNLIWPVEKDYNAKNIVKFSSDFISYEKWLIRKIGIKQNKIYSFYSKYFSCDE
jgi:hypothetical protein